MNYKTIDFSKYSSFKLGPKVDVALLEDIKDYSKEFYIIGGANNLLVSNNPPKLMMLSKKYDYIKLKDSTRKNVQEAISLSSIQKETLFS